MIRKTSKVLPGFEYFVSGEKPTLLIHSGTHGDEYKIIDLVKKYVFLFEKRLPNFIFVPKVSPSAVSKKTRTNSNGLDLNRIFFSDSNELEIKENIKIIDDNKFDLMVSFHEDCENDAYYIYDSGYDEEETTKVLRHNRMLKVLGIKLFNGVDDPDDPELGYKFIDGYRRFVVNKNNLKGGVATDWAMLEKGIKDTLVPEIPGKLSISKKDLIIKTFFEEVLAIF